VAPQPSAAWRGPALAPGGFVLARDPAGNPRWEHNQVAAVNGDALELDNRDGKRRSVKASDVVAIVEPQ
jgi:hypothetical protein